MSSVCRVQLNCSSGCPGKLPGNQVYSGLHEVVALGMAMDTPESPAKSESLICMARSGWQRLLPILYDAYLEGVL